MPTPLRGHLHLFLLSPNSSLSNLCQCLGHIAHPRDIDAPRLTAESGDLGPHSEKPFA